MQFKAGYIVDSIAKVITDYKQNLNTELHGEQVKLDQINGLLQHVSSFDIKFPYEHKPDYRTLNPVLATLNNVITRGLPTKAPILIEELFSEIGLIEPNTDEVELNYPRCKFPINYETVFELLHILEPGLNINRSDYGGNLGSEGEWGFLDVQLNNYPYAKQILQSQRDFATINRNLGGDRRVDFSFELPYLNSLHPELKKKGIIFEYDGTHHNINSYKYYDRYRDDAALQDGFETLRQSSDEIELDNSIIQQFKNETFCIFKKNFEKNIEEYLKDYTLIFVPLAVVRIQKTMLEYFITHPELFEKEKIEVAIIERDLPCGAIAIATLQELFKNINAILEEGDRLLLPEISLTIFENSKWVLDKKLHLQANIQNEEFFNNHSFDFIIDNSILRRSHIYKESDFQNDNVIKIRSSHYFDTSFGNSRRVYCADLLHYSPLVRKKDDGSYESVEEYEAHINFFIQNIFRKVAFREGQLPIISRALQQKPVIGLLPTGGGKSLTFQLSAFLQPGLCLIVDPIKSLMEDQVRVLKESWIDCCNYINSNLNHEERVKRLVDFRYGETMFLFVSPERFVMEDFRDIIKNIDASLFGLAFAFCVIDEVHCVSEWGHDFRTTYLMLGKNAQHFSKTRSGNPVTLVGLTATASFDVLADIERELQIQHEDVSNAIIMIENTIRPELFFRVIDVEETQRMQKLNEDFSNMGNNLQKLNNLELLERSIQDHKDNFEDTEIGAEKYLIKNEEGEVIHLSDCTQNDFYSIIFCPVKGQGGHAHGVDRVYQNLNSASKGYFYSSDTDDINQEVQKHFENFVTGSTKHIVCTKAFGMGIDKKNIRSTYHFVYSGSLESLVQEAGRAGRDKKIAEANILVSNEKYFIFDVYSLFSDNIDNGLFHNQCTRKSIRQAFERRWNEANNIFESVIFNTQQEILDAIEIIDFSLLNRYGRRYNILPPENIDRLKTIMKNQDGNHYKYVSEKRLDRGIHDFFHQQSFKGVDTERSQFLNLFKVKEFQLINNEPVYLEQQDTLANTFENCTEDKFDFIITERKTYTTPTEIICGILEINPNDTPPFFPNTNTYYIDRTLTFSHDFNDFLLTLDENNVTTYLNLSNLQKERLLFVYSRDREQNDTGKLIYRMHSMGFLIDYRIDYITKLYNCKFKKFNDITNYVQNIEKYLRRYLSENTALQNIEELKKRLTKDTLIDNIIECLYFLSEFSYKEIANKRKRATDEVESVMNTSITNPDYVADWYKQNHFIKEQIYFYFNAKYARIGFKISGIPYSLLDDYQGKELDRAEILNKYLDVFQLDGTEQNNYKHMMGSCKKILRSLGETDLNSEWLLRLLKAFAMYSVNNPSYTSEANEELEEGFDNLYNDKQLHQNNFDIIEPIFENYFNKLQTNIQENNTSFKNIKLIRIKLLQKMQTAEIEKLTNKYQQIKGKIYA